MARPPTRYHGLDARIDREYRRLQARIRRRYATTVVQAVVGDREYAITRVADPERLLVELEHEIEARDGDETRCQPYWADLWDSARAAAALVAALVRPDVRLLDLGCGLGLPGCVAASLGAQVLLADAAPPALLFARLNSWPWQHRAHVRRLDWRRDRLPCGFDLIVGADILYERLDWPFLEAFWQHHLAANGQLLLGEPGRPSGHSFLQWLTRRGWQVAESRIAVPSSGQSVRVFQARRSAEPGNSRHPER